MKTNFRKVLALAGFSCLLTISSCCLPAVSNPDRPAQVRGWQKFRVQGIDAIGEFVLKKGESVDNQTVGVELVDVIPGKSCRGRESSGPSAVVRFFRVSDKQTIFQIERTIGNTRFISFSRLLVEEYGIDTISIRAINTKDGWIWFELWS